MKHERGKELWAATLLIGHVIGCGGISETRTGAAGSSAGGGLSDGATQPASGGAEASGGALAAGGADVESAAAVCTACSETACSTQRVQCQTDQGCQDIVRCIEAACQSGESSCSSGCIGADGSAFTALSLFACVAKKCGKDCVDLGR
ncbi:MAG: hypothetical protein ABUL62_18125 [Myxococcales bacterium]